MNEGIAVTLGSILIFVGMIVFTNVRKRKTERNSQS
jgi:hypothetical protein